MASDILRMMMDTEAFSNEKVRATPMPISLKEAFMNIVMVYSLNKIISKQQFS